MMARHTGRSLLGLALVVLAACTVAVKPEWVTLYTFQSDQDGTPTTWLNDMALDAQGHLIATGAGIVSRLDSNGSFYQHDALFLQLDPQGRIGWTKTLDLARPGANSSDEVLVTVNDDQNYSYSLVRQSETLGESEAQGAGGTLAGWLVSLDANGNLRWKTRFVEDSPLPNLLLQDDRLYVAHDRTRVFDTEGHLLQELEHDGLRMGAVAVAPNGDIIVSGYVATARFSADGEPLWTHEYPDGRGHTPRVMVASDGTILVAQGRDDGTNGDARLIALSADGTALWHHNIDAPRRSFGLMGPAMIMEDFRGDLFFVTSNNLGRRMVKLDRLGNLYWDKSNRNGIVNDATLSADGLFLAGNGHSEKRALNDGSLLAEARISRSVQVTTGSVLVDGNQVYVGHSAVNDNGHFAAHIARYQDH